jgi:acyl-CoA synthetase (AMP-forming)/AMP-acid ligase II
LVLGDLLDRNIRKFPQKTAVVCIDSHVKFNFKELNERINGLVNAFFQMGMRKGERIAILEHNCHRHIEVFFAAAKSGMVVVPLNFRLTGKELSFLLNDSEASTLIVGKEFLETVNSIRSDIKSLKHVVSIGEQSPETENYEGLISGYPHNEPEVNVDEDDPVTIIYTSGTTGVPKGVLMTHRNWFAAAGNMVIELGINPNDITLHVKPFFHVGPIWPMLSHFYMGGTNVVLRGFDPEAVLETIEREKVTNINTAPIMILRLLNYPRLKRYDLNSLRLLIYGASPMPVEILKRALGVFGNIMTQNYGSTEGIVLTRLEQKDHILDRTDSLMRRLGSCGKAGINVEARVVDERGNDITSGQIGEIIAKGDHIMEGYWKRPGETASTLKGGWLYTGDLATVDDEGYIYIVDRKKDMIISGGENIYPREIEEVIYTHPAVSEVAVIGVPDSEWGESVKAVIIPKTGRNITVKEIMDICKRNLASYKKPRSVEFLKDLPRTPSGKILKRELRKNFL